MNKRLYLALINRAGGLYGRILTEVVITDQTQWGLYTWPRSRFSHTDWLSSVNKMFIRAVFNWVLKVISELLWFCIYFTQWLVESSRAIFSTNQKWKQNQSWLTRAHFPALCFGYVYILRVLIGLLDCLRPFWLAKVITLVLVLWHSIETRSMWQTRTNQYSILLKKNN